jgi:hypothetical protein
MQTIYREPVVEEGIHNLVLQNRCGNRLTLLVHPRRTELELTYKPNAHRRKDLRARNFSGRDNQTTLFAGVELPELGAEAMTQFEYDPFVTRVRVALPDGPRNTLTFVNWVDENAFAVAADRPLSLAITPHEGFAVEDGCLVEGFRDRGEAILSFVLFDSFEANRFRVLDDGRCILQLYENELIVLGGEESEVHLERVRRAYRSLTLERLIARNEAVLEPALRKGRLTLADPAFQQVLDLNRRIIISGMDAGGACFGALNRIYYLIWNRDGSQVASMAARSGMPDMARVWAPFILENPACLRDKRGELIPQWMQILGSRWTKREQDGIFYVALSLFSHYETTGDPSLLEGPAFERFLEGLDHTVAATWDAGRGLFGADVRGEDDLVTSPYFGYDVVNGSMPNASASSTRAAGTIEYSYTLYHNVNLYNALLMAACLLRARGRGEEARAEAYAAHAERLGASLLEGFVDRERNIFHTELAVLAGGEERWVSFDGKDPIPDYWEYAWAISLGPFLPDLGLALSSARFVVAHWSAQHSYGYCPWNTLSRFLKEYGVIDSKTYAAMLQDEVVEARTLSEKYPLFGALTEYHGSVEGWRPLPFSASSFWWTLSSNLLQALPCGLAVRAGEMTEAVGDFHFRTARLEVTATGRGDHVGAWTIGGEIGPAASLQIPEDRLAMGPNTFTVERVAERPRGLRLYGSSAALLSVDESGPGVVWRLRADIPSELVFENADEARLEMVRADGSREALEPAGFGVEGMSRVRVDAVGVFTVVGGQVAAVPRR